MKLRNRRYRVKFRKNKFNDVSINETKKSTQIKMKNEIQIVIFFVDEFEFDFF